MATDFAVFLHRFLASHLAGLRGCSPNTIASYRDTFKLLIAWFRDCRSIPPDKLTLDRIDADAITAFLDWLEAERHNSISTRNQRRAAVSSFFRWLQTRTRPGWPAARTSSPSPPNARPSRASITSPSSRLAVCSPSPTGPPGEVAVTRPCWPPST